VTRLDAGNLEAIRVVQRQLAGFPDLVEVMRMPRADRLIAERLGAI
jgi:hypothetical protein